MRKLLRLADKFPLFKVLPVVYLILAGVFAYLIHRGDLQLLDPAGYIADIQSKILWGVIIFALIVGTTMIGGFFFLAFHYREGKKATYAPEWHAGPWLQVIGWGVPFVALSAISVMVWNTAHQVDPYKPIASTVKPVTIQVVALQWKWLFIYPDDHIAAVNTLEIPTNTPISFKLTADAPMNSFWIPRLSGQIYAMTGMVTQLHVMADKTGVYAGGPAEISGGEFAGMEFKVSAIPPKAYAAWKDLVRKPEVSPTFDYESYKQLARPSGYVLPKTYRLTESNLFDAIVMQFMVPSSNTAANSGGSV